MPRPLPVAHMPHYHDDTPVFSRIFCKNRKAFLIEFAVFLYAIFTYGEYLKSLHHKIAKVMKKSPADSDDLFIALIGKSISQILNYNLSAVTQAGAEDEIQKIGK